MKYTMSDGRAFTSYLPNCDLNYALQKKLWYYGFTCISLFFTTKCSKKL